MRESAKQYRAPLIGATVLMVFLVAAVVYVYLSPTGWKAREDALLNQVDSDQGAAYRTLDGESIDLSEYKGKLLIVNVWASWSPYTAADHTVLQTLKEYYGEDITIRALNRKESKETAVAYLDTIGMKPGIEYILDTTDHFYTSFDGYAMPETIVFDTIGNVLFHEYGTLSYDAMIAQIDQILK
jgi:thiol-disulfide isomerase/thioredoxin